MRFKIVVPSYNCAKWIGRCLQSIAQQDLSNTDVCVIDDASTDVQHQKQVVQWCHRQGWERITHTDNCGALQSIVEGVAHLNPDYDDVIMIVDGDDWLYNRHVLTKLRKAYAKQPITLTYGQYITYPKWSVGSCKPVTHEMIDSGKLRQAPWYFSHLRTFQGRLWEEIKDEDLRDEDGNYYQYAWDLALMYPMVEMAGHSIHYIHDVLYVYNQSNPISDFASNLDAQLRCAEHIRSRPPYRRIIDTICNIDGTNVSNIWRNRGIKTYRKLLRRIAPGLLRAGQ